MAKLKALSPYFLLSGLLLVVIFKLYFANTGFLNFEGSFFELGRQLVEGFSPLKSALYFQYQANPMGTSFLISIFYNFIHSPGLSGRLPAIILIVLSALFIKRFLNKFFTELSENAKLFTLFYFLIHPSIWIFSGRAMSDSYFIFITVALFCLYWEYLQFQQKKMLYFLMALIAISCFIKLNISVFVGILLVHAGLEVLKKKKWNNLLDARWGLFLAFVVGLGAYFFTAYFLGVPFRQNNESLMQLSVAAGFRNVVLYNLHFFVVTCPFSLFCWFQIFKSLSKKQKIINAISTIFIFAVFLTQFSSDTLFNTGELNFGGNVDQLLSRFYWIWALPAMALALSYLGALISKIFSQQTDNLELYLVVFYIFALLSHCLVKPVQRYLLVLIFWQIIMFLYLYRDKLRFKNYYFILIFIFFAADIALSGLNKMKSDTYLDISQQITDSRQYFIDISKDPLAGNLFGNIEEKYLVPSKGLKPLCLHADQVVDKPIVFQATHTFLTKKVTLLATACD